MQIMDARYKLYKDFKDAFISAHPDLKRDLAYKRAQELWNNCKKNEEEVKNLIRVWHARAGEKNSRLMSMWARAAAPKARLNETSDSTALIPTTSAQGFPSSSPEEKEPSSADVTAKEATAEACLVKQKTQRSTPAQDTASGELKSVNAQMASLLQVKNTGLWTAEMKAKSDELDSKKVQLEKQLKRLSAERARKQKFRLDVKRKLAEVTEEHPVVGQRLKKFCRQKIGRPRLEDDQPQLLKTIVDIVLCGAAADPRRRSEKLTSCKTLDDLHEALVEDGFCISRAATYLRLLPRNSATIEGRRHVNTVPVKLLKAANSERRNHVDAHFAAATICYLKDLGVAMGEQCVFFLSQDDKARVPLGLSAANKQAPILMHMEYRVQLPDHDWVIAERHKLIPSVYAACVIKPGAVSYSGPTAIFIRSGKHDSSTAMTHAADFEELKQLPAFQPVMCINGSVKPLVIITVDGGPDENPRFPKTLAAAYRAFHCNNLDAIFIACHAPGHSAYNAVERRMAPLSRDLSGLILPHNHYGSHLDGNGKTCDLELERANFQKSGEVLAEIWSSTVIDGYDVAASFVSCDAGKLEISPPSDEWSSQHIQQSQYCLQIVKCNSESCCGQRRTNYNDIFPARFLPPPVPYNRTDKGITYEPVGSSSGTFGSLYQRLALLHLQPSHKFLKMPFDLYCPSITADLEKRVCDQCGLCFPSQAAKRNHARMHKKSAVSIQAEVADEGAVESDTNSAIVPTASTSKTADGLPIVRNLFDWLQSAFVEME